MEMHVQDIRVQNRIRQDVGDIRTLMDSIKKYGMLNPIVVTRDGTLVAGYRRLQAAKRLGWTNVPVHTMLQTDEADLIEIEIDENLHRKPFTEEEQTDAFLQLQRMRNPTLGMRLRKWLRGLWHKLIGVFRRTPRQ